MREWLGVALKGAIVGIVVATIYLLIRHGSGGNWAAAFDSEFLNSAVIGGIAGALAFIVRRNTR